MTRNWILVSALAALLVPFFETQAEPWISNRYAQNCAGCHSPSRRNLPTKDRRCTLSCQGCHTNPSGGGLRNHYGIWNQQRWLRSAKGPEVLRHKSIPAPLEFQKYGKMSSPIPPEEMKTWQEMAKEGPPLAIRRSVAYKEEDYDRSDRQEFINSPSPRSAEFLARVTDVDPLRTERSTPWSVGADFRYLFVNGERDFSGPSNLADDSFDYKFPMAFDIGARYRPIPKNLQLVFEHRYYNYPPADGQSKSDILWTTDGQSVNRSAYVLIDDLSYNTYVMYGNYKPMFNHSSSDHTTLLANITTSQESDTFYKVNAYSATNTYRAVSFGGSPNVPFFNLHWIMPRRNGTPAGVISPEPASSKGYVVNLGGRFVTLGASFMLSYWDTVAELDTAADIERKMLSASGGFTKNNWVINFDVTQVERKQTGKDKGQVQTIEGKYRFYRENYFVVNYATANTARNLRNGEAVEMALGFKSFYIPGTEFEFLYITRDDRNGDTTDKAKTDQIQLQAHLFF